MFASDVKGFLTTGWIQQKLNSMDEKDIYEEMVHEKFEYLYCDNCYYYPIEPVHGHFMCPKCHMPTKCCEGAPAE